MIRASGAQTPSNQVRHCSTERSEEGGGKAELSIDWDDVGGMSCVATVFFFFSLSLSLSLSLTFLLPCTDGKQPLSKTDLSSVRRTQEIALKAVTGSFLILMKYLKVGSA